ncbi:hypothetical protein BLD25_00215 [Candidatus Gracilibacteria bacterium GN02-872]|nr:hypothetical protein BLD25_00215 [Candidatus Gracilibacteria bacterium GN02-872]
MDMVSLGASLSIGLACLGVAFGQCYFIYKVMDILGKNPKMTPFFLTIAILGVALIESSAIFGLIVAMQLLGAEFSSPLASLGAGLAIGLTGLGVGMGEGLIVEQAVVAANKNTDEKNKILSYMILLIALVESTAIYGIIVAMRIIGEKDMGALVSLGAGLSIGLTGLGVSLGMSFIARKAMEVIGEHTLENNKIIIPFTILGLALIESAAIYGLVIALNILTLPAESGILAIGASLSIGLAGFGVSIGLGMLISKSISRIGLPWISGKSLIPVTVLGVALVESAAIYGLVVAFQIIGGDPSTVGLNSIGAGLAVGLAGAGVGLGEGYIGERAMQAMTVNGASRAKITTYMVLFIAMVESLAIYGLIIAIRLVGHNDLGIGALGAGVAIGLAGAGVALGGGFLSGKSIILIGKRPELTGFLVTVSILGMAILESSGIYGLIVSFQIIGHEAMGVLAIGSGLAIGLAGGGVGLAAGHVISGAFEAIARNPKEKTKYLTFMILFVALIEVLAIYGFIIAFQILGKAS